MDISSVLWKKETLKLPLEHYISGMRCFSASPFNLCESKAEHLPTLSAAHTTQADPRATSPGSPSISQGTAATAPSQRTLGLCFPFLQTALYGSAATQQVHLPGQPHWQQLTREAGPPHSRSVSSGLLETLLAAAARVLLFVWRILLLQPFKLTFDLRPPICFTERVYKQANGSYQLIIHNS